MSIRTELSLRVPNTPGALARVCDVLAEARVNVLALHLESSGRLRLLVDNPLHAAAALRELQHQVDERDVLYTTMANAPGALSGIARLLAGAGVNLDYAYAGAVEGSPMAVAVLGVPDVQRASAASGL
jgi:hypothetical protein